jgi:anti-sigma B factor antagonist
MEITSIQQGDVSIIKIMGSVDAFTAGEATAFLKGEVDAGRTQLVVDLTEVEYMSSAGLRTVLMILKQVRQFDGDLRLANPQEAVAKVLTMAGLTSIMSIYADLESAIDSFKG